MARIIIADDDATTCDLMRRALESEGHSVFPAQDGQEALDIFSADPTRIDLIVSDVQMPGLDGISMIERALAVSPRLKAIVISGYADGLTKARKLPVGRVNALMKPVSLDALRAAVVAALAK